MDTPMTKKQVSAKLTISCGCGFLAQSMKEAAEHALSRNHTMTVHGSVGVAEKLMNVRVVSK